MRRFLIPGFLLVIAISVFPGSAHAASPPARAWWDKMIGSRLPADILGTNGRLEAEQLLVAPRFAGRVLQVLVEEGQMVDAGAVVVRMDTAELEAQLAGAEAQVRRSVRAAAEADAIIVQRRSELTLARREYSRALALNEQGYATAQQLDQRRNQLSAAESGLRAAEANIGEARAAIEVANADAARLRTLIEDATLRAPRRGRVEYRLVHSGEVVGAGAPIVTLLDLADIHMTVFVPAQAAGRLSLGDEARLVFDPAPGFVVPATITYIASDAQFTPKAVETADERAKLAFRLKLSISADLLRKYEDRVKAGVRGMAYLRTRRDAHWPSNLAVRLP